MIGELIVQHDAISPSPSANKYCTCRYENYDHDTTSLRRLKFLGARHSCANDKIAEREVKEGLAIRTLMMALTFAAQAHLHRSPLGVADVQLSTVNSGTL